MTKFSKLRRWIVSMIGILPLIFSLANVRPVLADTTRADLSVRISVNRHTIRLGQTVTFTVRLTNLGPDVAENVAVLHSLPDQLSFLGVTCDGDVSADGPYCEYRTLAPGETRVSTVMATTNPDAPHRRRLVATAQSMFLNAGSVDPHHRNDSDSVVVRWVGRFK